MKTNTEQRLEQALNELKNTHPVFSKEIPDLDLYMDQVTTWMEEAFSFCKRSSEDKILTKTMVNNYTKHQLLPPPTKKKYSKNHVIFLIYIYYLKNFLSMKEIETLLTPLSTMLEEKESFSFSQFYDETLIFSELDFERFQSEILTSFDTAKVKFSSDSSENYLALYALIFHLISDMFTKKALVEQLIAQIPSAKKGKKK